MRPSRPCTSPRPIGCTLRWLGRPWNAGKHVMCEKPLAMNSRESAELVALAAKTKLAAGVNYNIRYYPLCLQMREMVRSGELGSVFSVCGSYVQDWLLYPTDYNWRVLAEEGGELRAVADIGTHWLDLVHSITGLEVESVCADLATVHPVRQRPKGEVETFSGKTGKPIATEPVEIKTEDSGCILLQFAGGGRGCLWVSQVTAGRKNCLRLELAGSGGAVAWNSEQPNELWIGHRERANELLIRDPALVAGAVRPYISFPGGHNEGFPDTFKQCFRAFYGYIRQGDFAAPPSHVCRRHAIAVRDGSHRRRSRCAKRSWPATGNVAVGDAVRQSKEAATVAA